MNDYMIDGKLDPGGRETDKRAMQYMRENPGTDYIVAVKTVQRESHDALEAKKARAMKAYRSEHGEDQGGPMKWRIYADADGNIAEMEMAGTGQNINRLSNIVTGLPRLPDHSIDAALAVQVINSNFSTIRQGAAGDFLFAVMPQMRQELERQGPNPAIAGSNNPQAALEVELLKAAAAKYPEVNAVYNGGRMTEEALRTMLWPLFKPTTAQYQSRGAEVRRYSSDSSHISYDTRGNEVRKYVR